jgi:hypothetical protein
MDVGVRNAGSFEVKGVCPNVVIPSKLLIRAGEKPENPLLQRIDCQVPNSMVHDDTIMI